MKECRETESRFYLLTVAWQKKWNWSFFLWTQSRECWLTVWGFFPPWEKDVTCYQVQSSFQRNKLQQSCEGYLIHPPASSTSPHPSPLLPLLRQLILLSPGMARLQYLQVQGKVSVLAFLSFKPVNLNRWAQPGAPAADASSDPARNIQVTRAASPSHLINLDVGAGGCGGVLGAFNSPGEMLGKNNLGYGRH